MLAGRIGGLRCGGPLFDLAVEKREKGLEIHAFSACAARLSDFLLCLSCRECPIRPCGAPSPRGENSVSGIAASSYRSLPHWGRGTASAVDRVLSYIVCLRRFPSLSFIPLEPYPARFARHLPHAGKAVCRGYPLLKRRRSRHLNPEPNESKVKRTNHVNDWFLPWSDWETLSQLSFIP